MPNQETLKLTHHFCPSQETLQDHCCNICPILTYMIFVFLNRLIWYPPSPHEDEASIRNSTMSPHPVLEIRCLKLGGDILVTLVGDVHHNGGNIDQRLERNLVSCPSYRCHPNTKGCMYLVCQNGKSVCYSVTNIMSESSLVACNTRTKIVRSKSLYKRLHVCLSVCLVYPVSHKCWSHTEHGCLWLM